MGRTRVKHLKTLATRIGETLSPIRDGAIPLAQLLHMLGYTLPDNEPYGRSYQRQDVIEALAILARRGRWKIILRDMSEEPCPLGPPTGLQADTTWVLVSRPFLRGKWDYLARTVWSTDPELLSRPAPKK